MPTPALQLRAIAPYVAKQIDWDMSPEGVVPDGNLTDGPLPEAVVVVVPFFGRPVENEDDYGERTVGLALSMAYGRFPKKAVIMSHPVGIVEWLDEFPENVAIPTLAPPSEVTGLDENLIINMAYEALAGFKAGARAGGFAMDQDGKVVATTSESEARSEIALNAILGAVCDALHEAGIDDYEVVSGGSPSVGDLFPGDDKMADLDEALRRRIVAYQRSRNAHLN